MALATTLATARSSSAGSATTGGSVSATSTSTLRAARAEAASAAGTTSSSADGAGVDVERAGLEPAHVEQVADEGVEPVGLLVDRARGTRRCAPRCQSTSSLQQARDRRLDRRERRAQVVGDRCRSAVRSSFGVGERCPPSRLGLRARSSASDAASSRANASSTRWSSAAAPRPASDEHVLGPSSTVPVAVLRVAGRGRARGCLDPSSRRPSRRKSGDAVEAERRAEALEQRRAAGRRARRGRRAAPRPPRGRAPPRPLAGPRATTSALTSAATARKTTRASDVLGLGDRQRVERRREEPVGEQEPGDRRGERRPDAADRGDADDEQQEEQEHARQAEVVAQLGQHHGEQRQPDRARAASPASDAPPGQAPRAPPCAAPAGSSRPRRSLVGDHVDVEADPEPRITRLITEPCVSSSTRDRRLAPSTSWVAFSRARASTSAAATSAPTTSWYLPPSSLDERCAAGRAARPAPPARPSCGTHVHAEQLAVRALGDAGGPADRAARRRARR